jgi:hypothetical protein
MDIGLTNSLEPQSENPFYETKLNMGGPPLFENCWRKICRRQAERKSNKAGARVVAILSVPFHPAGTIGSRSVNPKQEQL